MNIRNGLIALAASVAFGSLLPATASATGGMLLFNSQVVGAVGF